MLLCYHANIDWCYPAIGWNLFGCKPGPRFHFSLYVVLWPLKCLLPLFKFLSTVADVLVQLSSCEVLYCCGQGWWSAASFILVCFNWNDKSHNSLLIYYQTHSCNLFFPVIHCKFYYSIYALYCQFYIVRILLLLLLIRIITGLKKRKSCIVLWECEPRKNLKHQVIIHSLLWCYNWL